MFSGMYQNAAASATPTQRNRRNALITDESVLFLLFYTAHSSKLPHSNVELDSPRNRPPPGPMRHPLDMSDISTGSLKMTILRIQSIYGMGMPKHAAERPESERVALFKTHSPERGSRRFVFRWCPILKSRH